MSLLYGFLPEVVAKVGTDIQCDEMMYYLYLPIKAPHVHCNTVELEKRLQKFIPIIDAALADYDWSNPNELEDKYVYLTVKTLPFSRGNTGQRSGWHSDGFMTNDTTYIWYTDVPTIFLDTDEKIPLVQDHVKSISEMEQLANNSRTKVYPCRTLLKMDESVIHKVDDCSYFEGVRTFVKISISSSKYALQGNSISDTIDLGIEYKPRLKTRNCPTGLQ